MVSLAQVGDLARYVDLGGAKVVLRTMEASSGSLQSFGFEPADPQIEHLTADAEGPLSRRDIHSDFMGGLQARRVVPRRTLFLPLT